MRTRKRTEPAVISKGCQGVHGWLTAHEAGRPVTRGRFKKGFAVVSESARFGSRLLHCDPFLTVSNIRSGVPVSHLIFAPPTVHRSLISALSLLLKLLRLRSLVEGKVRRRRLADARRAVIQSGTDDCAAKEEARAGFGVKKAVSHGITVGVLIGGSGDPSRPLDPLGSLARP